MSSESRDGMNVSVPFPSSIVAAEAMADDVSMTKITLRPDKSAIAAEMLDFEQGRAGHLQTVAPFDDDRPLAGQLLQAEVGQLRVALDPIEVHVGKQQGAGVHAHH